MKLKNKKTGEIKEFNNFYELEEPSGAQRVYCSIAELNEEWEDYEEPVKPYWFVNDLDGEPMKCDLKNCGKSNFIEWGKHRKQIGNYFETKEEAEKAVERLKAWKRLKDLDTEILGWEIRDMPTGWNWQTVNVKLNIKSRKEPMRLLDLLFGGEE